MAIREQILDYGDGAAACKGFLAYDDTRPGPLPAILISHAWGGREATFDDAECRATASLLNFFDEVLR